MAVDLFTMKASDKRYDFAIDKKTYAVISNSNSIATSMSLNLLDTGDTLQIGGRLYSVNRQLHSFSNTCIAKFLNVFCKALPIFDLHDYRLRI